VNWKTGEDVVILASIPKEEADKLFPQGYRQIKPYLRMTSRADRRRSSSTRSCHRPMRRAR